MAINHMAVTLSFNILICDDIFYMHSSEIKGSTPTVKVDLFCQRTSGFVNYLIFYKHYPFKAYIFQKWHERGDFDMNHYC